MDPPPGTAAPLEAVTRIQRQLAYCNGGLATTLTSQESRHCVAWATRSRLHQALTRQCAFTD